MKDFFYELNLKWDKRTLWNLCKMPFLIFVRVPLVLLTWFVVWLAAKLEAIDMPGWNTHNRKKVEWF